jgi:hypothetical protein
MKGKVDEMVLGTTLMVRPNPDREGYCGDPSVRRTATRNGDCLWKDEEAGFDCQKKRSKKDEGRESHDERFQGATRDQWDHAVG